ncbi:MAG: asparagine synthase (glutamine-hydrolyzing) [Lentisphaeria bacterium]|nr:asparagine synthase (glutamine-hydrolyzing) [Lentisphaeria bacterium]
MCGICGYVTKTQHSDQLIHHMVEQLHHRGPDANGVFLDVQAQKQVALGHARLAVLDLSDAGAQPMHFEHLSIVYNGEVYNFKRIRKLLEELGYEFNSNSDTEVILKAFHAWGEKAVDQFIGMFAIVLFDHENKTLSGWVDRAGVKPLYYSFQDGSFLFGSELRSMIVFPQFNKEINLASLSQFFKYGAIAPQDAIYKDTHKLRGGYTFKYSIENSTFEQKPYWSIYSLYNAPIRNISKSEALKELSPIIEDACALRMIADVPVGVFLSGGYDSTLVAATLSQKLGHKLDTFSIGFHESHVNEAADAKLIAKHLGTNHHEFYMGANDALRIIRQWASRFDEPFAEASAIPTALVSEFARGQVTVALSGDGGDETFGGYEKYWYNQKIWRKMQSIPNWMPQLAAKVLGTGKVDSWERLYKFLRPGKPLKNFQGKLFKLRNVLQNPDLKGIYQASNQYMNQIEVNALLKQDLSLHQSVYDEFYCMDDHNSALRKMMAVDYQTFMNLVLQKVDRSAMYCSLETREPLLDHRLIEFAAQLPDELKMADGRQNKVLLRSYTHQLVPKELMDRPKAGFAIPLHDWLKGDLKDIVYDTLSESSLKGNPYLDWKVARKMVTDFENTGRNPYQLWLLLCFEMWRQEWL